MLGKLIEKVISERLQFQVAANDFIHPSQLGGLKFKFTIDVGIALMHIIYLGWVKNISTSTLAFDIAQFFLSLNHCLLTCILKKAGLDNHIINFFANYFINRKTNYFWNNFSHFVSSLSFSSSLYFRKLSKKSQYFCVYHLFCG